MGTEYELDLLEDQIREIYGRVVYTHKTQEKCSNITRTRNNWIKITQIVLSAITTTGFLAAVFGGEKSKYFSIASAILSAIYLMITTYTKNYDFGEISQKHANCACHLWNIRESYLSLLVDVRSREVEPSVIKDKRDKLQEELHSIYKGCERSFDKAYKEASKALKEMEDMTFSDEEIDHFLPSRLKKKQKSSKEEKKLNGC